jgi:DNA-binding transcriptional regulator of glucitol operon
MVSGRAIGPAQGGGWVGSRLVPASDVASKDASRSPRSIWWTKRAVGLHVTIVVLVPVFLGLFWWQIQRVRQGNTLSWAYVFEWPFFTGYAIYLWWKLVHDQPEPLADRAVEPGAGAEVRAAVAGDRHADREERADGEEEEDEELAAYNRYLAELHASGRQKRW